MEMSKKIYLLRTENNLTQSEFARIAGATDKAVSSWESGVYGKVTQPPEGGINKNSPTQTGGGKDVNN